jgi:hypothetical protein
MQATLRALRDDGGQAEINLASGMFPNPATAIQTACDAITRFYHASDYTLPPNPSREVEPADALAQLLPLATELLEIRLEREREARAEQVALAERRQLAKERRQHRAAVKAISRRRGRRS